jgi:hypothetical protein
MHNRLVNHQNDGCHRQAPRSVKQLAVVFGLCISLTAAVLMNVTPANALVPIQATYYPTGTSIDAPCGYKLNPSDPHYLIAFQSDFYLVPESASEPSGLPRVSFHLGGSGAIGTCERATITWDETGTPHPVYESGFTSFTPESGKWIMQVKETSGGPYADWVKLSQWDGPARTTFHIGEPPTTTTTTTTPSTTTTSTTTSTTSTTTTTSTTAPPTSSGDARISSAVAELKRLAEAAKLEKGGDKFKASIDALIAELELRKGFPLSPETQIVLEALEIWKADPGNLWGEYNFREATQVNATALDPSGPDYADVAASQNKCNAYVAEALYKALRLEYLVYESTEEPGKYFPYRAKDWADPKVVIRHYELLGSGATPRVGDIISTGTHVGIYLGLFKGQYLYVSARDTSSGVFGVPSGVQAASGIHVKTFDGKGVYRRYTP